MEDFVYEQNVEGQEGKGSKTDGSGVCGVYFCIKGVGNATHRHSTRGKDTFYGEENNGKAALNNAVFSFLKINIFIRHLTSLQRSVIVDIIIANISLQTKEEKC